MELHFQPQPQPLTKTTKSKKTKTTTTTKFVGVRQRPSGRWVAEIKDTTQKIRMWLGTFETAEEAARAYDEAACLLRGSNTRTNFSTTHLSISSNSPLASRIRNLLNDRRPSMKTPPSTTSTSTTSTGSTSTTSIASLPMKQYIFDGGDDDVYRPSFGGGPDEEFEMSSSSTTTTDMSWVFEQGIELPPPVLGGGVVETEMSELERMKVERQISASLYAMNGMQEYFDAVHGSGGGGGDPMWDLPPLCQLFCET